MNLHTGRKAWLDAALDTPMNVVCVKSLERDSSMGGLPRYHGKLSWPVVRLGTVHNNDELLRAVSGFDFVRVIGHGWPTQDDYFVWEGTANEFATTWKGD